MTTLDNRRGRAMDSTPIRFFMRSIETPSPKGLPHCKLTWSESSSEEACGRVTRAIQSRHRPRVKY